MPRYSRADIHARLAYSELALRIICGVSYRTVLYLLRVVRSPLSTGMSCSLLKIVDLIGDLA